MEPPPSLAPFTMCFSRSQTDGEGTPNAETGSGGIGGDVSLTKSSQLSIEDLSGEDPETRRLRTVKNIADLRQNLEETMSSLRGTQLTHRYVHNGGFRLHFVGFWPCNKMLLNILKLCF